MSVCAIIPAHQEEHCITATIRGLQAQTFPPSQIIVVADNCTDGTARVARDAGAEVIETVGNTGRKAGALNQALTQVIDQHDIFFIGDADTVIVPEWMEYALAEMTDPDVGAVGAIFTGDRADTWLTRSQTCEYARFADEIDYTGRTFVVTGTAAIFRREALQDVRDKFGRYYDEANICEDFRITTDVLACGWKARSPQEAIAVTETMPTIRMLFRQRVRWYAGALQTVQGHGVKPYMLVYLKQQTLLALGTLAFWAAWIVTIITTLAHGFYMAPLWAVVGVVFYLERVVTAPAGHRLYAATLVPELAYAIVLQAAYITAVVKHVTGRQVAWHHLGKVGSSS